MFCPVFTPQELLLVLRSPFNTNRTMGMKGTYCMPYSHIFCWHQNQNKSRKYKVTQSVAIFKIVLKSLQCLVGWLGVKLQTSFRWYLITEKIFTWMMNCFCSSFHTDVLHFNFVSLLFSDTVQPEKKKSHSLSSWPQILTNFSV